MDSTRRKSSVRSPTGSMAILLCAILMACTAGEPGATKQDSSGKMAKPGVVRPKSTTNTLDSSSPTPKRKRRPEARQSASEPPCRFASGELTVELQERMKDASWRPGCPVPLDQLVHVLVCFWGFDESAHQGQLVVHRDVADEVIEIFSTLHAARFPIEKMQLIESYAGSDERSMADNNTSAFNCRWIGGRKGVFSKHAFGKAIDINPLYNPYVRGARVQPESGKPYVDREADARGMIRNDGIVVSTFRAHGWLWGGHWRRSKDYQHFEKHP